jgi:pyruvate dehydrogenase E2 component (dihydrolipoamide acetyltransferase)
MEIVMPKMGESINEGTIIKWHKKKGDKVKRDEIIFEISTDKVDTEVPSPAEGVISEIKYNEGDTVEVGTVVAVLNDSGSASVPASETKDEKLKEDEHEEEEPLEEKIVEEREAKTGKEEEQHEQTVNQEGEEIEVMMPKMGESVMEGTIIKWHKKKGDKVKKDEILFEISTDKVDTEVPSPAEGILTDILVEENDTVEVGTIVAKLNSSEKVQTQQIEAKVKEDKKETEKKERAAEEVSEPESMHDNFARTSIKEEKYERENRFLSPLVMNIARKENISFDELDRIKGSGLNERITKKDILSYLEQRKSSPAEENKAAPVREETPKEKAVEKKTEQPIPKSVPASTPDIERIPMDNIRQKIMQHMVVSRDTSVHVSAMLEVDMTKIYNFIEKNREAYAKDGVKLTYMPFIAQAAVRGLREYPLVNSSVEGNTILKKKYINLGIAVAVEPTGLIVPNVKNADEKNITGLAKAIADIAARARTKKLTPDDITNGTFTITNYGVFGTIFGTPIINQPEVAILGVGAVMKKPVVIEYEGSDTIAIKPMMALTISHDHRLIDGMLGGLFLKFIKDTLENFDPAAV